MAALAVTLLAAAAGVAACDAGKQQANQKVGTTLVSLVEANIGVDRPLASNGVIRLRFDRYLLPSSITRQSFALLEASGASVDAAIVTYDPVSLSVTLRRSDSRAGKPDGGPDNSTWLKVGQPYRLRLTRPEDNGAGFGVRAIDGAPLNPDGVREIAFSVSAQTLPIEEVQPPIIEFCADVYPIFASKCSAQGGCHDAQTRAAGLNLAGPDDIRSSMLGGRVAQASNTGARASTTPAGRVFGVDMPLVDPEGNASNSFLLYKILLAPLPAGPVGLPRVCRNPDLTIRPPVASGIAAVRPDELERSTLSDFVLGREMPYPPIAPLPPLAVGASLVDQAKYYEPQALTFEERQRIRLWIEQRAPVNGCFACRSPRDDDGGVLSFDDAGPPADGGVVDGGPD